ncbi:MAG: hypothetical protein SOX43_08295 [Pelistega sp.]|nr:hypothetical protein [Pelistega sp.]
MGSLTIGIFLSGSVILLFGVLAVHAAFKSDQLLAEQKKKKEYLAFVQKVES